MADSCIRIVYLDRSSASVSLANPATSETLALCKKRFLPNWDAPLKSDYSLLQYSDLRVDVALKLSTVNCQLSTVEQTAKISGILLRAEMTAKFLLGGSDDFSGLCKMMSCLSSVIQAIPDKT
ncbi:MAG: hypothetical protein JGK01_18510 [Microcoleus sp. PH2017_03_ELD_O_A]|nr:hypothetical protein [Microcoleus sp. PH2017_03_ELD_O_A]